MQLAPLTLLAENNTVAPITYSIDDGITFSYNNVFSGLTSGTYSVTVKDGNGCISEQDVTIPSAVPPINVLTSSTNTVCSGESNGTVFVSSISGGNFDSSYQYYWYNFWNR